MKHSISIVPFEEYTKVNFYSIIIDNDNYSEIENFLDAVQIRNMRDASLIVKHLSKIGNNGAHERYFRYEGSQSDHVCAVPDHYLIETDYRLYLLRWSESLLIFGNGGIKTTKTYQEDASLNRCVNILQKIDDKIKELIKTGEIVIDSKTISGNLDFFIYT